MMVYTIGISFLILRLKLKSVWLTLLYFERIADLQDL